MKGRKKYKAYLCKECDFEFMTLDNNIRNMHCPICADYVEVVYLGSFNGHSIFNRRRIWNEHEDQVVIAGLKNGLSYKEIEKKLHLRTYAAIKRRVWYLKREGYF